MLSILMQKKKKKKSRQRMENFGWTKNDNYIQR